MCNLSCLLLAVLAGTVACHYYPATSYSNVYYQQPSYSPYVYNRPYYTNQLIVQEKPKEIKKEEASCKLNNKISSVPLFVVKEEEVNVVKVYNSRPNVETLVKLQAQDKTVPAVRVLLDEPLILTDWTTSIPFPSGFTILDHGTRAQVPIYTILAPVSDYYYPSTYRPAYPAKPLEINVVYAVPLRYPSYPAYPAYTPVYQQPFNYYQYPSYYQGTRPLFTPTKANATQVAKPQTRPDNLVTVLEFPNTISSPNVLYYQEVTPDNELGNRNPPEPIVPSGIVQSGAPQPTLTVFVNSKESAFLQALRDEAEKNKQKVTNKGTVIEAYY